MLMNNQPNLTLAAFCANLAYVDIASYVQITLVLPNKTINSRGDMEEEYVTLEKGATARNIAIYGQWFVTSIDFTDSGFDIIVEANPAYPVTFYNKE